MTTPPCAPGLPERSRAMHAEMDAASQDGATQTAIMDRHWRDALRAKGVAEADHEACDDVLRCLYHAASEEEGSDRMILAMGLLSSSRVPQAEPEPTDRPTLTPEQTTAFFRAALARGGT